MNPFIANKYANLPEIANQYKKEYKTATPFPNIYFDHFFNPDYLEQVRLEFPDLATKNVAKRNHKNSQKLASIGESSFGAKTKALIYFLNSEPFLTFLQTLTGIERPLIPDPYFLGGGLHEIKKGGFLKIHADFNKHNALQLDRRLNILIYLNKDWEKKFGGHFELWSKDMKTCIKKIAPEFNTVALFSTTHDSYHGHPEPLSCPIDRSRKSIALYYYTNGRPEEEIIKGLESHGTLYQKRVGHHLDVGNPAPKNKERLKSVINELTPPILVKLAKIIMKK